MSKLKKYDWDDSGNIEDREGDFYLVEDADKRIAALTDALHDAWGIIANAYDYARWHGETHHVNRIGTDKWKTAADRWRDEVFHPLLKVEVATALEKTGFAAEAKASVALDKGDGGTQVCEPEKGGWRAARGVLREDEPPEATSPPVITHSPLITALIDVAEAASGGEYATSEQMFRLAAAVKAAKEATS